eukprot:CAMPEP_0181480330 /NCGR_PEP_ID=MMETSP1110-20121109/43744_1 /TAXON_ID=174948 /ORGANISM="Symbiodinium sp., Strain CCMP421" /LENGTH=522 /DNA_ID=CAMNT_0023605795 /DNA_START=165 /DNA_END=1733 /DNA_ORIENTATION=+
MPDLIKVEIPGVKEDNVMKCYFENHRMTYLQQLDYGARFFMIDVCTRESGEANTFYDCHSGSGADEHTMGWRSEGFKASMTVFAEWLSVRTTELVALAPDNMYYKSGTPGNTIWMNLFAQATGNPCESITASTELSSLTFHSTLTCAILSGRPKDELTMGELIKRNIRLIGYMDSWRSVLTSSYGGHNSGNSVESVMQDFDKYATGEKPEGENVLLAWQVLSAMKIPDFGPINACDDVLCKTSKAVALLGETDTSCVYDIAKKLNSVMLQDDDSPYEFFLDKECPDTPCGCRGYQSPLERTHQLVLDRGHLVQAVFVDFMDEGEKQNLIHLTTRMNHANLRRVNGQAEPGKTWWDCYGVVATTFGVLLAIATICGGYAYLAHLYPKKYGVWIRKSWKRYQKHRKEMDKKRQEAKQKGREEAAEYLRDNQHIQGGPYDTQNPNANQSYQYQDYQNQTYQAHDPNAYGYQTQWQPGPGPAGPGAGPPGPSGPPATALGMAAVAPSGMDGEIILEEGQYKARETE